MSDPKKIKNWFERAMDIAAQHREARDTLKDMKTEDPDKQLDWARLMALATARDADLHDADKHDRVEKLLAKGTYASWYADIVGIGNSEQIDTNRSSTPAADASAAGLGRREPPSAPVKSGKGQSAEHNARSAPVTAVGGEGSGDRGPTAATNSESATHTAPKPAVPPKTPSGPAAEMAPSVSAATIRDSDEFNDIRGTMFDRSLWV